jgi:hypothetical protein
MDDLKFIMTTILIANVWVTVWELIVPSVHISVYPSVIKFKILDFKVVASCSSERALFLSVLSTNMALQRRRTYSSWSALREPKSMPQNTDFMVQTVFFELSFTRNSILDAGWTGRYICIFIKPHLTISEASWIKFTFHIRFFNKLINIVLQYILGLSDHLCLRFWSQDIVSTAFPPCYISYSPHFYCLIHKQFWTKKKMYSLSLYNVVSLLLCHHF